MWKISYGIDLDDVIDYLKISNVGKFKERFRDNYREIDNYVTVRFDNVKKTAGMKVVKII